MNKGAAIISLSNFLLKSSSESVASLAQVVDCSKLCTIPISVHVRMATGFNEVEDEFLCDLDEGALIMRNSISSSPHWWPTGPQSLEAVIGIAESQVCSLFRAADALGLLSVVQLNLRRVLELGIVLSSCYSGCGTFEFAAHMYLSTVAKVVQIPHGCMTPLVVWSATEKNPIGQKALLGHTDSTRCKHCFSNLMDRVCTWDRNRLIAIYDIVRGFYTRAEELFKDGLATKAYLAKMRNQLGVKLTAQCSAILSAAEFNTHAYCIVCKQLCPLTPRSDPSLCGRYWIEAAGSNCFPFSRQNTVARLGLVDFSTVLVLVWAYSCKSYAPDGLIHECVPTFPEELLLGCLLEQTSGGRYEATAQVFSPTDLGVPAARLRKFARFSLLPRCSTIDLPFADCFYRSRNVDLSVYMDVAAVPQGADVEYTASRLAKKEAFQLKCIELGLCNSDASTWHQNGVVANCSDHADGPWFNVAFRQHPTVCRSSRFFNLALDRQVLLQELWMVNGFPHPAAAQLLPATKNYLPPPSLVMHDDVKGVGKLSESEQRHLIGNCMHVTAIGSVFLQHVACVAW